MDEQSAKQPSYDVGYVGETELGISLSYQSTPHETKYCLPFTVTSERLDPGQDTLLPVGTGNTVVLRVLAVVGMTTEDGTEDTAGEEITGRTEDDTGAGIVGSTEDDTGGEIIDSTEDITEDETVASP